MRTNSVRATVIASLVLTLILTLSGCQSAAKKAVKEKEAVMAARTGTREVATKDKQAARTSPQGLSSLPTNPGRNPDIQIPRGNSSGASVTYSRVSINEPYVAMTFDDGPHPSNTPRLLDMLAQRNIKATFYVVGTNAREYPHIIRRMINEGHEIGNHTRSHADLTKLSDAQVRAELDYCRDAIIQAAGVPPHTMRPPYGAITSRQKTWIYQEYEYPTIIWSVDPRDWTRPGAVVVADRIVSGTQSGAIILAHDIHQPTIDAMPSALDRLLAKGYKFVTVTQLLELDRRMGQQAQAGPY